MTVKYSISTEKIILPLLFVIIFHPSSSFSLPASCHLSFSPLGTRKLEYAGSTWHEGCFICHSCEQPIGSKSFIPDKDEHYCVACYEDKFAPRCTRCKKVSGVTFRSCNRIWPCSAHKESTRPLTRFIFRPWLKAVWPIGTSRGIRSVSCAPTVRHSWQVNTSPPETTALTASSALAACMPRSARPAPNRSQASLHHRVIHYNIDLCCLRCYFWYWLRVKR